MPESDYTVSLDNMVTGGDHLENELFENHSNLYRGRV